MKLKTIYNENNSLARTIQDGEQKLNKNVDIDFSLSQIRFGRFRTSGSDMTRRKNVE